LSSNIFTFINKKAIAKSVKLCKNIVVENALVLTIKNLGFGYVVLTIIDISIVALIIYFVLKAIQHTRTLQLAEGIGLYFLALVVLAKLSNISHLITVAYLMNWLLRFSISFLPFLLVVVFQPELRKWFTGLGKGIFIETKEPETSFEAVIDEIVKSAKYLSLNKIGALIVIERSVPLNEYIETGVPIKAIVKAELLNTIFFPNTALHDGAVIIRGSKIEAARCVLPLSLDKSLDKEGVGTRHRAAVGITEETDAVSVVVSEQTGIISIAVKGKLTRYLSPLELRGLLLIMAKPNLGKKEEKKK
jgi:diadenylate cyclase